MKKNSVVTTVCVLVVLVIGLFSVPAMAYGQEFYTKYNIIGYQRNRGGDIETSYACWVMPKYNRIVLHPNTRVTVRRWKYGFALIKVVDKRRVLYTFNTRRMGMSAQEYMDIILSPTPVSIAGFSKKDKQGIYKAKPFIGMTKDGILTALGYPATHRTPSLDSNRWTYWKNKFATFIVEFDNEGKVYHVVR